MGWGGVGWKGGGASASRRETQIQGSRSTLPPPWRCTTATVRLARPSPRPGNARQHRCVATKPAGTLPSATAPRPPPLQPLQQRRAQAQQLGGFCQEGAGQRRVCLLFLLRCPPDAVLQHLLALQRCMVRGWGWRPRVAGRGKHQWGNGTAGASTVCDCPLICCSACQSCWPQSGRLDSEDVVGGDRQVRCGGATRLRRPRPAPTKQHPQKRTHLDRDDRLLVVVVEAHAQHHAPAAQLLPRPVKEEVLLRPRRRGSDRLCRAAAGASSPPTDAPTTDRSKCHACMHGADGHDTTSKHLHQTC